MPGAKERQLRVGHTGAVLAEMPGPRERCPAPKAKKIDPEGHGLTEHDGIKPLTQGQINQTRSRLQTEVRTAGVRALRAAAAGATTRHESERAAAANPVAMRTSKNGRRCSACKFRPVQTERGKARTGPMRDQLAGTVKRGQQKPGNACICGQRPMGVDAVKGQTCVGTGRAKAAVHSHGAGETRRAPARHVASTASARSNDSRPEHTLWPPGCRRGSRPAQ